jgi:hypothetical protein
MRKCPFAWWPARRERGARTDVRVMLLVLKIVEIGCIVNLKKRNFTVGQPNGKDHSTPRLVFAIGGNSVPDFRINARLDSLL